MFFGEIFNIYFAQFMQIRGNKGVRYRFFQPGV